MGQYADYEVDIQMGFGSHLDYAIRGNAYSYNNEYKKYLTWDETKLMQALRSYCGLSHKNKPVEIFKEFLLSRQNPIEIKEDFIDIENLRYLWKKKKALLNFVKKWKKK